MGSQLYGKKMQKSRATPLLWNPAKKDKKIKTFDVTIFFDILGKTALAFISRIKSDLIDIVSIICAIFYIPNSLHDNWML